MLKLDLLVPIILILCLIALAYILSKVFSPAEQEVRNRPNTEIVLDESAYRDGDDLGAATNSDDASTAANVSNTATDDDDLDEYYQDDSEGTVFGSEEDEATVYYDEEQDDTESSSSGNTSTTARAVARGQYMVITGSFRQKIYAQQLVRDLKRDGFADAYVGITNRGAYAVAVAGNSSSYSSAKSLESKVRSQGYYDTFVKQAK